MDLQNATRKPEESRLPGILSEETSVIERRLIIMRRKANWGSDWPVMRMKTTGFPRWVADSTVQRRQDTNNSKLNSLHSSLLTQLEVQIFFSKLFISKKSKICSLRISKQIKALKMSI